MTGNQHSGRKPKAGGVRTSILVDGPTITALQFISEKQGISRSAVVEKAVEEYFLTHYEKELEEVLQHEDRH